MRLAVLPGVSSGPTAAASATVEATPSTRAAKVMISISRSRCPVIVITGARAASSYAADTRRRRSHLGRSVRPTRLLPLERDWADGIICAAYGNLCDRLLSSVLNHTPGPLLSATERRPMTLNCRPPGREKRALDDDGVCPGCLLTVIPTPPNPYTLDGWLPMRARVVGG